MVTCMAVVSGVVSVAIAEPDRCKAMSPSKLVNQSRTVSLFVFFTRSPHCVSPRAYCPRDYFSTG